MLALAGCGGHSSGNAKGTGTTTGTGNSRPRFQVGAVEDAAKWAPDPAKPMREAHDAGFGSVLLSAVWKRGADAQADLPPLQRAVKAAVAAGIQPMLTVYQLSSSTPLSDGDRSAFAAYAAALARALPNVHEVFVGNEPNLNLFWQPQFDESGGDAAASGYEQLLASTYDALKGVDSNLAVVGGNLSPRGGDDPSSSRQTHSPTRFIRDLGAAYRASGRDRPLMDAFSIHVYGESSSVPPSLAHPNTTSIGIADYRKLEALLAEAFRGTAQNAAKLPIDYGEYGVETAIPSSKQSAYSGHEVINPVDEATQAKYYREAISLAACQPNVRQLLIFHVLDEQPLEGLQSGLYYADGTPKSSLDQVRPAIEHPSCRGN
jgi:hypothetical protein